MGECKEQGKAMIAAFSIVFALGAFFYVSNEQFKEEMKQAEPKQTLTPKYNAKAQLVAACKPFQE